jgi:hypothetical protein
MSWRRVRPGVIHVAIEERLEDSLCAELVDEAHHGMAFGVLAMVNGIVDRDLLWSVAGTTVAFGHSAALSWQARCWWLGFVRVAIPLPKNMKIHPKRIPLVTEYPNQNAR